MTPRRGFLGKILVMLVGLSLGRLSWQEGLGTRLYAAARRILPGDFPVQQMIRLNPRDLDTQNLKVMPLESFGTMGTTDWKADLSTWRLRITGAVDKQLTLTYEEILQRPSFEKEVLLICPGFFANHGRWKGVSLSAIFKETGIKPGARGFVVKAPDGHDIRFSLKELSDDNVFLATEINGVSLPTKHGYPLRVVARDRYGNDWVKYIQAIDVSAG